MSGTSTQERNSAMVAQLSSDFQGRYEPNFAWKSVCATYLALPGLRAFWPMSSIAYTNPRCLDVSGNANHLTSNNANFGYTNLVPIVTLNGAWSLSKTDGGASNWADVTGTETYIDSANQGLTIYAWVYFDNAASVEEYIIAKWGGSGTRSYRITRPGSGILRGSVSVDGTAVVNSDTTATLSATTWYFVALQYDPSTKLSVWLNGDESQLAAGIPASIFDSTSTFYIGASSVPSSYITGDVSMVALCASFHSDSIIKAVFNQTKSMYGVT